MFSRRFFLETLRTLRLAAPISGMFLATMLMQIVDTFFVGKLGADALGGLSIGVAVFSFFMVTAMGLLLGLDYLVSKAYGERDLKECRNLLVQGLILATTVSLPLIGLMHLAPLFFRPFGLSDVISANATAFLIPLSWSLLPFLLTNAFRMYLQGQGNAAAAFYVVVLANVLNFILNPVLIFGAFGWAGMGIAGSGVATFIGRWFSLFLIVGLTYFHTRLPLSAFAVTRAQTIATQKKLLKLGLPAAGQLLLEVGVFVATTFSIGLINAQHLAAHQIVLHIASFTFMIPLGISAAGAVRVGQAVGRRHFYRVATVGNGALFLSFMIMASFGLALSLFGDSVLRIFSHEEPVIAIGKKLLIVAALFQISDGFQVTAAGVLRGIGNTKASLWANFVGHWWFGFPLGLYLCFGSAKLESFGAWIGLSVGLTAVAAALMGVWLAKSNGRVLKGK